MSENENVSAQRLHSHHHSHYHHIIAQVADWLKVEKAKQISRKPMRLQTDPKTLNYDNSVSHEDQEREISLNSESSLATSEVSEAPDLEKLEKILAGFDLSRELLPIPPEERKAFHHARRSSFKHGLLRRNSTLASSDTDYVDGDALIPSVEMILDNSKTLSYTGGAADSEVNLLSSGKRARKEKAAWLHFKNEILRLAHTLKLKGWRRVPLDREGDICVERISGALTNAVYMVSPPSNLPQTIPGSHADMKTSIPRKLKPPPCVITVEDISVQLTSV